MPDTERGTCVALIYALVAERLSAFYEHYQWLTVTQGASLCSEWMQRNKHSLANDVRKHLSGLSDQLARQIAESISREAGLFIAHEMMESLDPNYQSDISKSIMTECGQLLDSNPVISHEWNPK